MQFVGVVFLNGDIRRTYTYITRDEVNKDDIGLAITTRGNEFSLQPVQVVATRLEKPDFECKQLNIVFTPNTLARVGLSEYLDYRNEETA